MLHFMDPTQLRASDTNCQMDRWTGGQMESQ